jgi:carbamoyl-phosphate synthase small subunit
MKDRKLVLANGHVFKGRGESAQEVIGEVVFNTSMVGTQEIVTDPSYYDQIVVMTYPLIGNYGFNQTDSESQGIHIKGLVVKEYNDTPSNFRSSMTLKEALDEHRVPLIQGIDTRTLTKVMRDEGMMLGIITDEITPHEECLQKICAYVQTTKHASQVSTKKPVVYKTHKPKYHVALIDFGTKLNIIRMLNQRGCNVTLLPHDVSADIIKKMKPDGIFLSNGPGDPEHNEEAISLIKQLKGQLPIVGICLGHQLIGLAYGASTYKLKFGHRGSNHPIKHVLTGKLEITAQNHSYAIDTASLAHTDLMITHINLLDNTVEGVKDDANQIFSIQYHPESAAGPEDSVYLFDHFLALMQAHKEKTHA